MRSNSLSYCCSPERRIFLARAAGLSLLSVLPARQTLAGTRKEKKAVLRIGLTPVFLDDQMSFTARWRQWFEDQLDQPVVFVQRGNYREVVDLLRSDKIDFAWLCGYPFVRYRRELRLVAVPLWRGEPYYQSYIIADASNIGIRSLTDLRGAVFAYSDPDSNSGHLYPQFALAQAGQNSASYFSRTFFTWSHRKVVEAVSVGLATGGAVDGYIWETLAETQPELVRGTSIVERSPRFGQPPFVARRAIPEADLQRFRAVLFNMASDPTGAMLLSKLRLDGFVVGSPDLYDGIARMAASVRRA